MIIAHRVPSSLTSKERLSSIATLLALGYLRLISRKESLKELDVPAKVEAPCDHPVNCMEKGDEALSPVEQEVA